MAEPNRTGRKGRGKRGATSPESPQQVIGIHPEIPAGPDMHPRPEPAGTAGDPEVPQVSRPDGIPAANPAPGTNEPVPVSGDVAQPGSLSEAGADGELQNLQNPQECPAPPGILEDPVEILVGLAERGEIDPWNIDIIEVTDRFLSELERRRELNLQLSGRTLFYAATLLRMKSEQLDQSTGEDEVAGEGDGDGFGEDYDLALDSDVAYEGRLGPIERLEHEIQRRLDRKNQRKSPITLFELIMELKNIEKEERRRRRMAADPAEAFLIDADEVVSIAHEEGFQESSLTRLEEYLEGLEIDEEMTLRELCERMEWGIPEVYIPLLFLALDGRCSLRQEEFFGDIWVQIRHADEGEGITPETAVE
jgi:segregation and condensation protein A